MKLEQYREEFGINGMRRSFFESSVIASNIGREDLVQDFYNINIFISNLSAWIWGNEEDSTPVNSDISDIFIELGNIVLVQDVVQRAHFIHNFLEIHRDDIARYVPDTEHAVVIMGNVVDYNGTTENGASDSSSLLVIGISTCSMS